MMVTRFHVTALLLLASTSNAWTPPQARTNTVSSISSQQHFSERKALAIPLDTTTTSTRDDSLDSNDQWIAKLDYTGFGREVTALGKQLQQEGGQDDVKHLEKVVAWRNVAAVIGIATMWMTPNPVSVIALSTWTYATWTMIGHHTCHGGYNRVDAGKYNSRGFAIGTVQKRFTDWLDWILPEAWNVEHNRLHHYRLNEISDPDLVQRNVELLRDMKAPLFLKYGAIGALASTWKWFYYAPNTFKELQVNKFKLEGKPLPIGFDPMEAVPIHSIFRPGATYDTIREVVNPVEFLTKVVGPFFTVRFLLLPAPLLLLPGVGPTLFLNAIANMALAELFTNLHSFVTIVTNHAGKDLYTFDDAVKPKTSSFYVRQIVGSANYDCGDDVTDFLHGYLNYQIEHHVWPDLSMLQYQKAAPKLKVICEKYGVPYVQENVFERTRKTVNIMVGKDTMRPFPTQYEPVEDKAGIKGVTWKAAHGAIDADD